MRNFTGQAMHDLMAELWPIPRSLTGDGVRQTLERLARDVPLTIREVPSGTTCFDWTVPDEWNVKEAFLKGPDGSIFTDWSENPLHLVGYSVPFEGDLSLDELDAHLHSLPEQPEAIPYVTSYYKRSWGFCLRHRDRETLKPGQYRVKIDATLAPGSMTYGELIIPGETDEEVFLSTYVCHPSMANNELSGPVLTTFLAVWLMAKKRRRYTYRIVFLPETIGSIYYLSRHLDTLKKNVIGGYVITCVGGPDKPVYLQSRTGDRWIDRITMRTLEGLMGSVPRIPYSRRGSDERQYCAPGADLPMGSIMRSKYHDYPEYHTSLDDLDFVRPEFMAAAFEMYTACLDAIENARRYRTTCIGEPNLGKRGLYPTTGGRAHLVSDLDLILALVAYSDGEHDLADIAALHDVEPDFLEPWADKLAAHGLLTLKDGIRR